MVVDNFLPNADEHLQDILSGPFYDVPDGEKVFKGIQPRDNDVFAGLLLSMHPGYEIAHNFVRLSPEGQEEPNFIHTDEMMGDLTAILYLTKNHPQEDGTTLYDECYNKILITNAKFNRLFVFDSTIPHSRNIYNNYGQGEDSRIVQVAFLKKI
jgi:hypothetical protein